MLGGRTLELGDQGDAVRAVQLALIRLGHSLQSTGNYGPATRLAVKRFQAQHGIEVDGLVGTETARALDRALLHRK